MQTPCKCWYTTWHALQELGKTITDSTRPRGSGCTQGTVPEYIQEKYAKTTVGVISWRNGSASDSRPEGCEFNSHRGHLEHVHQPFLKAISILVADPAGKQIPSRDISASNFGTGLVLCSGNGMCALLAFLLGIPLSYNMVLRLPQGNTVPLCIECPCTYLLNSCLRA
jgi:hypothetical protein